jgi:carboxypeptidase family protein
MRIRSFLLVVCGMSVPAVLPAQIARITGIVIDSVSGVPLPGTPVSLSGNGYAQRTSAADDGTFRFTRATPGTYTLTARRLGYAPIKMEIPIEENGARITISLVRVAALDTVRARPGTGIAGEVGTLRTLKPLRDADIQIVGVGTRLKTDAAGRFYLPLRNPGSYVVRARYPGYEPQTMSLVVTKDSTARVMLLLDSASAGTSNAYESAWTDFADRARLRGTKSAIVSREELLSHGFPGLIDALEHAQPVIDKQLRFGPTVCLFVDGRPAAASPITSWDVDNIEAVEVYTSDPMSDETHTLSRTTRGYECNRTGITDMVPERDRIRWVVIWLRK